jgi:DHA1 family tetracycline resistance protein-like MFS transporter
MILTDSCQLYSAICFAILLMVLPVEIFLLPNFILFVSNEVILVYCAAVLFALGGLMGPYVLSLLSKRAGTTHQGAVQGIAGSLGSLASIIGLTVGGFLYHFFEGATFLISSAVIFTVFIMSFQLLKNRS